MPAEIEIIDTDIDYAESILLPAGDEFDAERVGFIKNLNTIDLQAVPGSGKTTALLAKLLVLERHLPFDDGSGILVISHTNAAVDEVESKIRKYCPRLFSYPNHIGTIQSFVDNFLAIPFYINRYKKKLYRIDNDVYEEHAVNFPTLFFSGFSVQEQNNAKRYLRVNDLHKYFRFTHIDDKIQLTDQYNGNILSFSKPRGNARPQNYQDWTDQEKERVKAWLIAFKKKMFRDGVLCYDDAYFLGFEYLIKFPHVKSLIQKRFRFVFVDEMQDMDKHQHDLLENIFYDGGNSISTYQRIGDKNQAIFNGSVKLDEIWSERETISITGSCRLTQSVAEVVNCFALFREAGFQVNGLRRGNIKPHLIVYENETIETVISKFSEIIRVHIESGEIVQDEHNIYKAIAWIKEHPEAGKIGLSDYFKDFDSERHIPRVDYFCLESYLKAPVDMGNNLVPIYKNILNAFLKILRIEGVKSEKGDSYTKNSLLAYLKENYPSDYDEVNLNLFQWSFRIAKGKSDELPPQIREYIPKFLTLFGKEVNHSGDFINHHDALEDNGDSSAHRQIPSNTVNFHGFDIEITTIHAEKGKTHTATLYLETFHSRGWGNYESQRLHDQFKYHIFDATNATVPNVVRQSTKMMYVGMSRPTHLLCVAVHKERFDRYLADINREKWIVDVL